MNAIEAAGQNPQTLAQRMAQSKVPVLEGLRYAMSLAEALRKIHDTGLAHGAVSPACIQITRTGLELLPALGSAGTVTPYTAPEVAAGGPADSRSDIFSFGAILYELLTGRCLFKGDTPAALAESVTRDAAPPSGSPAVDRLLATCLAKDPAARCQRVQKLLLELKLLSVAVRRAESTTSDRHEAAETALRAEIRELETRLNATVSRLEQAIAQVAERITGLERLIEASGGRVEQVEQAMATIHQDTAVLRDTVSEDFHMFEVALRQQAASVESTRTAVAQTDDLVERVVEALESLQTAVLDHADDRAAA